MEDISKELLFVRTLEKVRQIAKEQGNYIREEQVKEEFLSLDLSDSQLQMVFEYLAKYGIVDENIGIETGVTQKEAASGREEINREKGIFEEKKSSEEKEIPKEKRSSGEKEIPKDKKGSEGKGIHGEKKGSGEKGIHAEKETFGEEGIFEENLTEKEWDYLQTYLDEIAALPVYEKEELEADAIASMAGDTKAQGRLLESFLKDVADIAKLYVGQGVLLEDLIGEGNMALAMGVQMLGSKKPKSTLKSFSEVQSLLVRQVMDAMEALVRENAANEKADQKVAERVNLVADKAKELAEELRRKVTLEELAQEAGLSIKAIQDAMRMSGYKIEDIKI